MNSATRMAIAAFLLERPRSEGTKLITRAPGSPSGRHRAGDERAALDHGVHCFEKSHVGRRVAAHRDHVAEAPDRDRPDILFAPQRLRGVAGAVTTLLPLAALAKASAIIPNTARIVAP